MTEYPKKFAYWVWRVVCSSHISHGLMSQWCVHFVNSVHSHPISSMKPAILGIYILWKLRNGTIKSPSIPKSQLLTLQTWLLVDTGELTVGSVLDSPGFCLEPWYELTKWFWATSDFVLCLYFGEGVTFTIYQPHTILFLEWFEYQVWNMYYKYKTLFFLLYWETKMKWEGKHKVPISTGDRGVCVVSAL